MVVQLLAAHLDVGYINNLIAAFWRAPVFGTSCPRSSWVLDTVPGTNRSSGAPWVSTNRTSLAISGRGYSGYDARRAPFPEQADTVDWIRLRRLLGAMTTAFGRPIIFKSFHLGFLAARAAREIPGACFVQVHRDPVDNALSILNMRRRLAGDVEAWTPFRPRELDTLAHRPYWEQVAGQVFYLNRQLEEQLAEVDPERVLKVRYEDVCADARSVVIAIRNLLGREGAAPDILEPVPDGFELRRPEAADVEEHTRVASAVAAFGSPERAVS